MERRFEPVEELVALGSFDTGIAKDAENVFQALSKETFASDGLGDLARRPQMTTPGKAEEESQSYEGEELLELSGIGHVGVFKVEAPLLEVAEELLDSPAQLVKSEGLLTVEAVAHEMQSVIPTPFASDGFTHEEEFHSEDCVTGFGLFAFAGDPVFAGQFAPDDDVGLDAGNVVDSPVIKPSKPVLAPEFAIHREDTDIFGIHDSEDFLKELDSLFGVGVATFGGLGKDSPGNGNGNLIHYDTDSKNIDVPLAMLPIGAVHRKNPTALGARDFRKDNATDRAEIEGAIEEESLEATVATFIGSSGEIGSGEEGEIDGAMPQQTGKKENEALEAGEVEFEGSEFLQKMVFKHPNFGWPSALQALFAYFSLIFNELRARFLSCSVTEDRR